MISSLPFLRRFASRPLAAPLAEVADAVLARAALARDRAGKEAFVEIVRRHQNAVCAVAYGVAGRLSLTEDIAQEAFLYAWKNMRALRDPARLKAWLLSIARSKSLDALRREVRTGPLGDDVLELASPDQAPDMATADAEDERLVWSALADMPEHYRVPLALFYNEGQSIAAVATALELSEDAVKQRLSRGREALRKKVAAHMTAHAESKLSGVLRRVQPGPLLIVGIATAIGLLSAPAAMAAGAFTGASAGGPAAAGATFSTAMTASSYLVAGVTLAAFIPLGWQAHGPVRGPAAPSLTVQKPASGRNPLTAFAGTALLKEWKRLHDTHGSDAAAMPAIYEEIAQEENAFRRRALRSALISEWGVLDPPGAFAFLQYDRKQSEQTTLLMLEWLARDPSAAAQHLASHAERATGPARTMLVDVAKAAPAELAEVVRRLPASDKPWDRQVTQAFTAFAAVNPDAAREAALDLSGIGRRQALAGVAEGWARQDGPAVLAWARTLPEGEERDDSLRAALTGWARLDPAAAISNFDAAPALHNPEDPRASTAVMMLRAAAEKDFEATVQALEKHQAKLGLNAWEGITDALQSRLENDPAATLTWLSKQPESLSRSLAQAFDSIMTNHGHQLKDEVLSWLDAQPASSFTDKMKAGLVMTTANREPEEAVRLLAGMEPTRELQHAISSHAARMMHSGQAPEEIDAFVASLPEAWRAETMVAVFRMARGFLTGDLTPWVQRMEQLPPQHRPQAAAILAGRMAAADPEATIQWAGSLTDAALKTRALSGLMHTWAAADSYEASAWVDSLPPGNERDTTAAALAGTIARSDPDAAWTWAASVGDPDRRLNALGQTLAAIHKQDPQRARQLLHAGSLTPADRLRLGEFIAADPRLAPLAPAAR